MKKIILILVVTLSFIGLSAQERLNLYLNKKTITMKDNLKLKIDPEIQGKKIQVTLSNASDPPAKFCSGLATTPNEICVIGNDGLLGSFYETFTVEQISMLASKEAMIVIDFFWDMDGNITRIEFILEDEILLSIEPEIYAKFYANLKKNVKMDAAQGDRINGYGGAFIFFEDVKNGNLLLQDIDYSSRYPK